MPKKLTLTSLQVINPITPQPSYLKPPLISLKKWHDIIHKQERDILILEIREEIFQKAIQKYNKTQKNKKNARILSECAVESWRRIIGLYFFQKGCPQSLQDNDVPDEPCRADSLSSQNIPLNSTFTVPQSGTPYFNTDSLNSENTKVSKQEDKFSLHHSEVQLISSCSLESYEDLEFLEEEDTYFGMGDMFRESSESFETRLSDFSKLKLLPEVEPGKRLPNVMEPRKKRRSTARLFGKDCFEKSEVMKELGFLRTQVKVRIDGEEASVGELKSQTRQKFEGCPYARHRSDRDVINN